MTQFPEPTSEQRIRFEREFTERYPALTPKSDHDDGLEDADRTNSMWIWCAARAYSEGLQGLTPLESA